MDIPVLISESFEKLSEVKEAIDKVNLLQTGFNLSLVTTDWIPDGANKRVIDQDRLVAEIEGRLGKHIICAVIVQNPLKYGFFTDGTPNIHIISTAEWTAKPAPPPLEIYLIYMLAYGLLELGHEIPEEISNSLLHDPAIGCISDTDSDKDAIESSMRNGYICSTCAKTLIAHGVSKQAVTSTRQMLLFVTRAMVPYDEATPHDAFLCYSSSDKKFAQKLVKDLKAKNLKVWFDEFDILPGESLYERIQQGILKSNWFMILLSPKSVQSDWCKRELNHALAVESKRNAVYVIPVMYKKCEVPGFLLEKRRVDLSGKKYEDGLTVILKRLRNKKRGNP